MIARAPLAAFGTAAVLWATGCLIVNPQPLPAVLAYLTVATMAVGFIGPRLIVFVGLWETAIVLIFTVAVLAGPPSLEVWSALWATLIFGSLAFIGWVATGSAFLEFARDRS